MAAPAPSRARLGTGVPPLLRWSRPGYGAAFTTRAGGVSAAPFDTLNLGWLTDDDRAAVTENRRRVAAAVGAAPERVTMMWQRHGAEAFVAEDTGPHLGFADPAAHENRPGDACVTGAPGRPLLAMGADCLPLLLVATAGPERACAAVHAGWRGLTEGVVERAVALLGDRFGATTLAAVLGPAAAACCYEVGDEVAGPLGARYGDDLIDRAPAGGRPRLGLAAIARRALAGVGVDDVDDLAKCTMCDPQFFSHRRDGPTTGRHAGLVWITPT